MLGRQMIRALLTVMAVLPGLVAAASHAPELQPRIITATGSDRYLPPTMANGQTGATVSAEGLSLMRVFQASMHDDGTPDHISTLRPGIVPIALTITADADTSTTLTHLSRSLDMDRATYTTDYQRGPLHISTTFMALRQMPHMMLMQVRLTALRTAEVEVVNQPRPDSTLTDFASRPLTIWCEGGPMRLVQATATYNHGRSRVASASMLLPESGDWQPVASTAGLRIRLRAGQSATFAVLASECNDSDFADPYNEASRQVIYASRIGVDKLVATHIARWADLWKNHIEIEGDHELQMQVNSALFNLYSNLRADSRRSIAPMGLTSDKYYGHTFWDADTWIFPVMAVMNPALARSMVDYRSDGLDAARRKASAYGWRGAMYPWEADHHGEESTPLFALTGPFEHHVTADVGRAAWQYFCVTSDTAWLASEGYPILRDCADFWVSRVSPATPGGSGTLTVRDVVGADEYAIGVDGDAFTNGAAMLALRHAAQAARILGLSPDPAWTSTADAMDFRRFPGTDIIREHEQFDNAITKQADVELLAYPLGIIADPDAIRDNIAHYAQLIDSIGGPAMSHSAMAVNYARMGDPDHAARLIDRAYRPNLRGGFNLIAETPGNDEVYFMTGAGGLLQAIIFGYGGLEISDDGRGVVQVPHSMPASIRRLRIVTPHGVFVSSNSD